MKNITVPVLKWVECSNELWLKWFKDRTHGAYTFAEVEDKLCEIFVCSEVGELLNEQRKENFFSKMRVQYLRSINETRQICVRQRSGNIICAPRLVDIDRNSIYKISTIDAAGTMLDSKPYVEVIWTEGVLLEFIENLEFFFVVETEEKMEP